MKRIITAAALLFAALSNVMAQDVVVAEAQNNIEYKTITLRNANMNEIFSSKPTEVRLVDGDEGCVEISYPAIEEEYLNFGFINDNTLMIGGNGDKEAPKSSVLSETTPIYVRVSSSKLRAISNTSDMLLYVDNDRFARNLKLTNSLTMGVVAASITANTNIEITNFGTMTCRVERLNTKFLTILNPGYLYLHGETSAKSIDHNSSGIDNIDLTVSCDILQVVSMGDGVAQYRGTADNVDVTVMGKASIRTSELNKN